MTESERIAQQYDRVMHGDAWHGDPIWQILDGISPECAAASARRRRLTRIWEIVMHMTFWEGVATRRLAGERAGLDEALNFPPCLRPTEANWQKTRERVSRVQSEVTRRRWRNLIPPGWTSCRPPEKRTFYDEAHGVIQHNIYHAGQIALLKKGFEAKRAAGGL